MGDNKILIVDDSMENRELLSAMLEMHGWEYETAENGELGLRKIEADSYDIVLVDLMMPLMNGLELLDRIKESWPSTEVIIITAYGSIPTAIEAIKKGAFTYLLRPFEPDEVILTIKKIFELQGIRSENKMLREELSRVLMDDTLVYKSFEMKKILSSLDDVSQSNATVLVLGESGVGKELVAKAIHKKSQRAGKPFIKVSCAALPEQLLESELFGHEKGSFTGAVGMRKGRFEIANGGTLFLDEIGEISQSIQIKLLRVIQELEFERVGGTKTIKCDTRIIAATNRDLAEEVKNANFREDLFYRLNVISIKVPPLRERVEDTVPLAYHFLEKYRKETNKDISDISDEALVIMSGYKWPGNIRELENVIERAVVLSKNKTIEVSDLPENMRSPRFKLYIPPHYESADMLPLKLAKAKWEKSYLGNALKRHAGNISRTAEAIEIARKNLQEKIKQHDIDVASYLSKNHD